MRVRLAYSVVSWLLAQVAEFAFENFGAAENAATYLYQILAVDGCDRQEP